MAHCLYNNARLNEAVDDKEMERQANNKFVNMRMLDGNN